MFATTICLKIGVKPGGLITVCAQSFLSIFKFVLFSPLLTAHSSIPGMKPVARNENRQPECPSSLGKQP